MKDYKRNIISYILERLIEGDEFTTEYFVSRASNKLIAERTAKRWLTDCELFIKVRHGVYEKI